MVDNYTNNVVSNLIHEVGHVPGKKALQKWVYMLQECEGMELGLSFRMYHYGPYSVELESIVDDLEAGNAISLSHGDTIQIESKMSSREVTLPEVRRVIGLFGELKPWELELMASLHFLARRKPYSGTDSDKDLIKRKLKAWKGTKFSDYEVAKALAQLEEAEYLP